jgi:hypothetical protein
MGPDVSLRQRPAREIVADPHYERLLGTLEAATSPLVPRRVLQVFFETSEGTVGEVLQEVFDAYPQTVSIEVLLEDARWVGALDQARQADELELALVLVKAELEAVRSGMNRWDRFMLGYPWRPSDAGVRISRGDLLSSDRSHPTRRRRPPDRRSEHP